MNPEPTAYWCALAWLPPGQAEPGVVVEVAGTRITAVRTNVPRPPASAVQLPGLTIPGLADVHSHAFHRALRGRTQDPLEGTDDGGGSGRTGTSGGTGTFWTWRDRMYEVAERLDPDSYYDLAVAVYAELALAGVTCVGEFHYLHHGPGGRRYDDPNAMADMLIAAARTAGVRICLLDACYLTGGIGAPLAGVQERFGDGDAERWASRVDALYERYAGADDVTIGAAVHSVRAVPAEQLPSVAAWAHARAAPLHVHVAEQPRENADCVAAYGMDPVRLLFDRGVLGPRATAVHATHLDDGGVGLLAQTGTTVCLCPTTERDLADGLGPAGALARAGATLVLGSDSHAVADLFAEARALEWGERLATGRRGHWSASALLTVCTEAGHRALGFPDTGVIEVGARADLVSVRLDSVRTAGTDPAHAAQAVVFAATAADVDSVVSGGVQVVAGSRHRRVDDVAGRLDAAVRAVW
ncbi:formimidoylglutamate deiminase [Actinopolymorpha singaporensis]|uniref:Formiminoglutamate deiminase n=1 Tax=Actinopolymorpha singaporensis TaxID=117157 RepID=A0A1H1NTA5_9ACTN|nr:formimidoylglutamate deiminase [Actinopolymorpha singaporensis]SDS01995.1 formiminoglutamate deiminase [Actinopolymorpha singaporensis]